ncbi:MAG: redox-sensing transcriptional repressor Rex [Eubacteriales bacterium]|nr:redox-sensing transcriptional repressor Rex [Eubacteriales bacterium]
MEKRISEAVIRRLPRYYRYLQALQNMGTERISSRALGEIMETTASQIRQDLNCFGGFGQQGYGYNVTELKNRIAGIIGLTRRYRVAIVGAGNIGQALAGYQSFGQEGYDVVALFDRDESLIGMPIAGLTVEAAAALEEQLKEKKVDIVIITVPGGAAKTVAVQAVRAGVKAIWNFAPVDINMEGIATENAQLTDGLMALTYKLNAQTQ